MQQEHYDIENKLKELKKSDRKSTLYYALIPLGIIFAIQIIFWSNLREKQRVLRNKETELIKKDSLLSAKEKEITKRDSLLGAKDEQIFQYHDDIATINEPNIDTSTLIYQQIEQKNIADTGLVALKTRIHFNQNIKVDYYQQESDNDKVVSVLKNLGLKEGKNYTIKSSKIKNIRGPINSIVYGSKVDEASRNLLVLELIGQGFEIRSIEPFSVDNGREYTIQIIRNTYKLDQQVIKAEQMLKRKS